MGVDIHPDPNASANAYPGVRFNGLGLRTNYPFDRAYEAAEAYTEELQKRTRASSL